MWVGRALRGDVIDFRESDATQEESADGVGQFNYKAARAIKH